MKQNKLDEIIINYFDTIERLQTKRQNSKSYGETHKLTYELLTKLNKHYNEITL